MFRLEEYTIEKPSKKLPSDKKEVLIISNRDYLTIFDNNKNCRTFSFVTIT